MKKLKTLIKYLQFILSAKTNHAVHSPFIYNFLQKVVFNKTNSGDLNEIKLLRKKLLNDDREILIKDFGAGSHVNPSKKRIIKDIAKNSAKREKYGKILYNIMKYYKPKKALELGTSLGISTCYIAKGYDQAEVVSLEGCPNTIKIAKNNLGKLNIHNTKLIEGNFNNTLNHTLKEMKSINFIFIDGNHQKHATIKYYEECLKYAENNTLFIFDDIYWSSGMKKAWEHIKKHTKTRVSIDLFFIGIIFIKKELSNEHFKIRF